MKWLISKAFLTPSVDQLLGAPSEKYLLQSLMLKLC